MDREHAKFILQSYRPDGADASDPDFTEALKLAAQDRELGEWLADERADDAIFAQALSSVGIPEGLRDEILAVLEHDQSADPDNELDGVFFGAVANVQPPAGLREQILSAMEIEVSHKSEKVVSFPSKWIVLSTVAALLLVGFFSVQIFSSGTGSKQLALANAQVQSGRLINASHEIEFNNTSLEGVNQWLGDNGLPRADNIPQGLIQTSTKGGRKIVFDNGLEASMIFFEKKDIGEFYLMVLEADSIQDFDGIANLSEVKLKSCKACPVTHFNITNWKDDKKVYLLLTKVKQKEIIELF